MYDVMKGRPIIAA